MNEYVVTADAGKKRDRGVFMVTRRGMEIIDGSKTLGTADRQLWRMTIVLIDQFQFVPYPVFCANLAKLMGHEDLRHNADLLVDGNGVGEAVTDSLHYDYHLPAVPIITTGGQHVKEVYPEMRAPSLAGSTKLQPMQMISEIHVPKAELVRAGMIALAQKRVGIAANVRWQQEFRKQLMNFRAETDQKSRRTKYEAEDEEVHDDIVSAFLFAAWWCQRQAGDGTIGEGTIGAVGSQSLDWDPLEHM